MSANREACQRLHRMVAHYLTMYAWKNQLDCIVLQRPHLDIMLGRERVKTARAEWFVEDVRPWFPYAEFLQSAQKPVASIMISRVPFDGYTSLSMSADDRVSWMNGNGIRTAIYVPGADTPTEREMVPLMALLANGLATLDDIY